MAFTMARPTGILSLIMLLTAIFLTPTHAQGNGSNALLIYNTSDTYHYVGCYEDPLSLPDGTTQRALDGTMVNRPGAMTVPMCLEYCGKPFDRPNTTVYYYAGLEFSRECWCGDHLLEKSNKVDDRLCDTPCDGAPGVPCGGGLKLSLYNLTDYSVRQPKGNKDGPNAAMGMRPGSVSESVATAALVMAVGWGLGNL